MGKLTSKQRYDNYHNQYITVVIESIIYVKTVFIYDLFLLVYNKLPHIYNDL